eukprot:345073-Rhodomonas_salina.6
MRGGRSRLGLEARDEEECGNVGVGKVYACQCESGEVERCNPAKRLFQVGGGGWDLGMCAHENSLNAHHPVPVLVLTLDCEANTD